MFYSLVNAFNTYFYFKRDHLGRIEVVNHTRTQIPALQLNVALGTGSVPQFSHLQIIGNNSTEFIGLLKGSNEKNLCKIPKHPNC